MNDPPFERRCGATVEPAAVARDQRTLEDIRAGHAWLPADLLTLA